MTGAQKTYLPVGAENKQPLETNGCEFFSLMNPKLCMGKWVEITNSIHLTKGCLGFRVELKPPNLKEAWLEA